MKFTDRFFDDFISCLDSGIRKMAYYMDEPGAPDLIFKIAYKMLEEDEYEYARETLNLCIEELLALLGKKEEFSDYLDDCRMQKIYAEDEKPVVDRYTYSHDEQEFTY